MRRWRDLGLSKLPLEVIEVSDRRLGRAALEMVTKAARDGQTEVSVLIPTRSYRRSWALLLHGKNADRLVRVLGHVPHVNATLVPFNVADLAESQRALASPELIVPGHQRAGLRKEIQAAEVYRRTRHDTDRDPAVPPASQGRRAAPFGPDPALGGCADARRCPYRRQRG